MKTRVLHLVLIVMFAIPLSGCPADPAFALGVWLYAIEGTPGGYIGVAFLAGGEMDEFDPMSKPYGSFGVFSGELTWELSGNNLVVTQDNSGAGRVYAGQLINMTYMSGTWTNILDPNDTGSFVASKAPSN